MKFNKLITIAIIMLCLLNGCHSDLDIVQNNALSAGNMWLDESDATMATNGLYIYMRNSLKTVGDAYLCWGESRNGLWGAGTHSTLSSSDETEVHTNSMSSTNVFANWENFYKTINQANLIIKYVPQMDIPEHTAKYCLGNAHFARAWSYFWIARIWGDAPMPTEGYESADDDFMLPRAPKNEILPNIVEKDILAAESYITEANNKYVATPAAVQMLKADYALWMYRVLKSGDSYLNMASQAIAALGLNSNVQLESDYADIFSSDNKVGCEVIFAIRQAQGEATDGVAYYLGWNSVYIAIPSRNNPVPITGGQQWWWYTDRYKEILSAVSSDTRTKLTFCSDDLGPLGETVEWTEKSMGRMNGNTRVYDSDYILYRYGEAFLLDAEIKYYQQNYSGALSALSAITNRAYGQSDFYSDENPDAVKQAIIDENLKELVAEGRTWWMLIRMDAIWNYNSYITDKRANNPNILLWPITQTSMNSNRQLKQTEGWY